MKKLILIMLALVMVVSVLASCGGGNNPASSTKPTTPSKPITGGDGDEILPEEQINLDLDSIDYEGEVVKIFHWKADAGLDEFGMSSEDVNNDAVKDAIYKRNTRTEEDLGIVIEWHEQEKSGYTQINNFITKLETKKTDSGDYVDIVAGQTRVMPYVMIEGHLTELNTYSEHLDLDKIWWPEDVKEVHEIKGNLYFVSGDISANLLRMMTVLFVNKTTLTALGYDYDNFMTSVKNYEWTLDDLIKMTEGVYQDLDKNVEGPSAGDQFGLVTSYFHSDGLYAGLGYKYMITSTKDDQVFRLSSQIASETAANYVTKMKDWNATNDLYMDPLEKTYQKSFKDGQALFLLHRAWYGFELQNTDVKWAVIPTPALDENQKEYHTTIGNQYSSYGVCDAAIDLDRAAQTIQTLGYYAYNLTTPALFEVSFQGKFSKDDYNIEMFKIVRDSIGFDIGRVYDVFISGTTGDYNQYMLPNIVSFPIRDADKSFNFNSGGDPVRKVVEDYVKEANQKLVDFIEAQG